MRFITPRKTATGLGASGTGTLHHWSMTVTAVALAILTPLFIIVVGGAIGLSQPAVLAHFGRPWAAIVTALFITVGMVHFMRGTRIMVDDYFQGSARRAALIAADVFGWLVIACTAYTLSRMVVMSAFISY